jgi:hypothetical protein
MASGAKAAVLTSGLPGLVRQLAVAQQEFGGHRLKKSPRGKADS